MRLLVFSLICYAASVAGAQSKVSFDREIAPLLATHCLDCHNGSSAKGGLDLSSRSTLLRGGESGPALRPGAAAKSRLWRRISAGEMPPANVKVRLSQRERQRLKAWIQQGAKWGKGPIDRFRFSSHNRAGYDWWSLQSLRGPKLPIATKWTRNPIDRFVLRRLTQMHLQPSPRADARTLVRRLYADLIGLPPPPAAIQSFQRDSSPAAWRKLVNQLLESPHYGERWARHWLDVARFGESHGYEYNVPRENAYHYRDWVIRALNQDMPYDRFARMQIAGDLLRPQSAAGAAAVGFLVAGIHNTVLGKSKVMRQTARHEELSELASIVGQTFLGLTVHCARCHDHKFDPISSREYYQFIAVFAGVFHGERKIAADSKRKRATPVFTVLRRRPGVIRQLKRGDVRHPGQEVAANGLRAVAGVSPQWKLPRNASDAQRRLRFAKWLTDKDNGPFHRVIVNRVWHHHFGRGLVSTPSDLGFNGGRPTHPELLEWLAVWFRDHGYSLKKLHRLILTSATYQQASSSKRNRTDRANVIDRNNRWLWRQNARRVDAETFRDSVLDVAGELNRRQFGRGFLDSKIVRVGSAHYYLPIDPVGAEFHRRTIYRWHVRGQRNGILESFDCPDPSTPAPRRNVTTTPAQALSQWNHSFVLRMAKSLARRVEREVGQDRRQQVKRAWQLCLGRKPDDNEAQRALRLVERHGLPLLARVLFNCNEWIWIE